MNMMRVHGMYVNLSHMGQIYVRRRVRDADGERQGCSEIKPMVGVLTPTLGKRVMPSSTATRLCHHNSEQTVPPTLSCWNSNRAAPPEAEFARMLFGG